MKELIVIGAGAAGMMAAAAASAAGVDTILLEKNAKVGRKIGITGKGRCNLTNNCDSKTYIENVVTNPRFMYSAIRGLSPQDMMALVEAEGTPVKTERGGRVFPVSDRAFDVIDALLRHVKRSGAKILCDTPVKEVLAKNGYFEVVTEQGGLEARAVIIATGGLSYPATGSTGDGHRMAKALELSVIEPRPALIPLTSGEKFCRDLMGLSLKNVRATLTVSGEEVYSDFGEMLFTHFGVSGPIVLSASSYLQSWLRRKKKSLPNAGAVLHIDLKASLSEEVLDQRLLRDLQKYSSRDFQNALADLLPRRLIPVVVKKTGVNPFKKAGEISREERRALLQTLKDFQVPISGTRPLEEAIITAGGVDVKEIVPGTMMVKKYPGLFMAGELLDVDALTGGFNLQSAFAMGKAAGEGAAAYLQN